MIDAESFDLPKQKATQHRINVSEPGSVGVVVDDAGGPVQAMGSTGF